MKVCAPMRIQARDSVNYTCIEREREETEKRRGGEEREREIIVFNYVCIICTNVDLITHIIMVRAQLYILKSLLYFLLLFLIIIVVIMINPLSYYYYHSYNQHYPFLISSKIIIIVISFLPLVAFVHGCYFYYYF